MEIPQKLIAQTYNGAIVVSSEKGVVQQIIKYPYARCIYCYAHQLNPIILESSITAY